jgi:hypothetical protein
MQAKLVGLVTRVQRATSKESYHRAGAALLKEVAAFIGHPVAPRQSKYSPGTRVYSMRGGPAVLGEISIQCHGAGFWGQICRAPNMAPPWSRETAKGALAFLHRKASSADPLGTGVGSLSHWAPLDKLADENFLAFLARGLVPVDASCDARLGLPGFPVGATCGLCVGASGVTAHAPGCGGGK